MTAMRGFAKFIREQGVVGLAVGFILGGAISKLVTALVDDVINPLIGLIVGNAEGLASATFRLGSATVLWGGFVKSLIDFLVIAAVVYFGVIWLRLDRLDKKKEEAK